MGEEKHAVNRNTLDRYGFSHVLAQIVGLRFPPRAFCAWTHGWYWWDDVIQIEDLVGGRGLPLETKLVTAHLYEYHTLIEHGYENVHLGGLPFAYVQPQNIKRNDNALVAFIGKSAEVERQNVLDLIYLDYLESIRADFEHIYVSIAQFDRSEHIRNQVTKRGLNVILGASPTDVRSLIRTRIALEYCKYVSTNTFGSHIAYALSTGSTLSVFTPLYRYDVNKYLNTKHEYTKSYAERMEYVYSEEYLKLRWPSLFSSHPKNGYTNMNLGMEYIGKESVVAEEDIMKLVGWDFNSQLLGYTKGGINRILRLTRKL
jgi:hypothetical protein